ncbi:DUF4426 domain-containing protein [Idiomarina xiamenensis]|uniref:DUF4426 domain-containing protein n=1 Tax=Idiomarina xiamenensis 10-D-4 TaxID=740709 RepID=K2JJX8_9GAMM|nr:DUF4426 domain-containing protein [Idiomarina xiamenensis]EKE83726.1 hypothetical protein A10D4_07755 [Idiomarina xiamenensis 10-D-4]
MKSLGAWDVHYIAFAATFLTPEIANQYGIQRSAYKGVVNISLLDSSSQAAQAAGVSGYALNSLGQRQELAFKEVKEGDAIYYLAQVNYTNAETLRFIIDLTDGRQSHQLRFSQIFYSDLDN